MLIDLQDIFNGACIYYIFKVCQILVRLSLNCRNFQAVFHVCRDCVRREESELAGLPKTVEEV